MGVLSGVGPVGLAAEDPSWIFGELSHQAIDEGGQEHEACLELVQNCLCGHSFLTIVFDIVNYRVSTLYKIKI